MELAPAAERRIRDLVDENKSPKRKLEVTVSTENANMSNSGAKRKERLSKKDDNAAASMSDLPLVNDTPLTTDTSKLSKNMTQTLVKDQEVIADKEEFVENDPNLQGAACSELIEESKKNEAKDKKKNVKTVKQTATPAAVESEGKEDKLEDKENKSNNIVESEADKKEETKIPVKKVIKKIVTKKKKEEISPVTQEAETASPTAKPMERRRSKIFETAEKFQNLLTSNDSKSSSVLSEKPKKIFIPGVNVGGFKKEFERKASLTSTSPPDIKKVMSKKTVSTANKPEENEKPSAKTEEVSVPEPDEEVVQNQVNLPIPETEPIKEMSPEISPTSPDQTQRKLNAVNIISNAITKEGTRKSKSRPCMMRKPPVPFGIHGRSASGSIGLIPSQFSPPPIAKSPELSSADENSVTSSAEITLKSATLPRRKTTKAEIQLDYPPPRPAAMEFKTEVAHRIESKPELKTQRSEIIVPVNHNNISNRLR